ncbi:thioredoxin H-type-like [Cucurbita maxima]|uniref:Thioredoxin H-type-like n=1 Tax=Cucurbita maxima TaxID=3661 RepID=A0A6J1KBU8_CUCMA|nr:thioredoxin H-type-like [Cucurbita maxima]
MADMGKVVSCPTVGSWKQQFLKAKQHNKLLVVNFTATWCRPCRAMAPVLDELAKKSCNNVTFLKVDVDKLMSVANELGVGALPSFQFFKNGQLVDKFVGAKKDVLLNIVSKHSA